uniref:Neprosin PEP catalytic domain-containing protein n=1 Tax=Chenopodium quinoa TaxID=63459 RepID=A0A803M5X1_CHEQI
MSMMVVKCLAYLVALLLLLLNYGANGHRVSRKVLDYEKQFKLLQKTSVTTIKNEYGDIYDCVDFYKQPAFDHPLLANHTFHPEMKPSSFALKEERTISKEREILSNNMKSRGKGCPTGTIPIKRMSKDDFIKMKRFTEDYTSRTRSNDFENHFAVLQTTPNPSKKIYHGAKGIFTYHDPKVSDSQYTLGGLTIMNGDDTIKAGWMGGSSHCFNMLCSGFVNVNKEAPIDDVLEPMSKRWGKIYGIKLSIFKDPKDGNWWLVIGTENTIQGFWPGKIFNGLANSATFVSFGGEAYGPVDQPLPPIGSGYKGIASPDDAAYVLGVTVLDENLKEDYNPVETETYTDDPQYTVTDYGWSNRYGRIMFYGGTTPV